MLSIDAMGGDNAPRKIVEGVELALKKHSNVNFMLFGNQAEIKPLLAEFTHAAARSRIIHTEEFVTDDEKPGHALRSGRNSSMRLAINALSDGEADGVISAGNTGALMATAKFVLKTLPGIDRPAIATLFPTRRRGSVMLDLGANITCNADNLVQFAVMGEVFARHVLGLDQPSVGILNVGSEEAKGSDAVKLAAAILTNTKLPIKFQGFIEGDDIAAGTVDVIVTDGFTGNIALKTSEGVARMFGGFLKEALSGSLMGRLGALIASGAIEKFKMRVDPRRYNGAMFLGLNGICIKSHGATDAFGFATAIDVAIKLITDNLNEGIREDVARLSGELQSRRNAEAV
jgi:glycerol-3-phosphate acyltransferase PlsX